MKKRGLLRGEAPEEGGLRTLNIYGYVYEDVSPRRPRANGNERPPTLWGEVCEESFYKLTLQKYY